MHSTKVIFLPKGTTKGIISYLDKSGYEINSIDSGVLRFIGYPQHGWIDLKDTKMTKGDFLYKLTTSKAALKSVTLIPGETSYFFLRILQKELNLSYDKLIKAYNKYSYKKDGNIIAQSHNLPIGMDEDHLIFYLINYTNKKYKSYSEKIFGYYTPKKWFRYITIASIIQKEAASVKEMPLVSSVIHNRLKKNMKLQMDGSLNYGKYSHKKITYKQIREDKSDYNTYKTKGLPSNPVCAVSFDSIKAAIFPSKTDYLYFTKDYNSGNHLFSSEYKKHIKNIKKGTNSKNKKTTKQKKKNKSQYTTKERSIFAKQKKQSSKKSIKSLWQTVGHL